MFPEDGRLAGSIRRANGLVQHVFAAAYEYAIPFHRSDGSHPLESLVTGSAPLLQHARFTTDLLLTEDMTSRAGR
ncbi:hypothetical protein ACH4E7_39145 [Kitasatospora sp. NPDC018058]|uniref:hypothetical protein n=1 Tax=Kitasatospora sp. NPDC018058 TaxID=3364025 RepID=UPI0037BE4580